MIGKGYFRKSGCRDVACNVPTQIRSTESRYVACNVPTQIRSTESRYVACNVPTFIMIGELNSHFFYNLAELIKVIKWLPAIPISMLKSGM